MVPNGKSLPIKVKPLHPLTPPQPLATSNPLSDSTDSPPLVISYQGNHTIGILPCPSPSTQDHVFRFLHVVAHIRAAFFVINTALYGEATFALFIRQRADIWVVSPFCRL